MELYCEVPECERLARPSERMCHLHAQRQQRGQSLTAPILEAMTVEERFFDWALHLEDAYQLNGDVIAKRRKFVFAAKQYLLSLGWLPPSAPMTEDVGDLRECAIAAARAYAESDAEDDAEFSANRSFLLSATRLWLRSEGWTEPLEVVAVQEAA